jgi:regulator of protease activity HflC (stomatin/prohibitin superfamily)
MAGAPQSRSFRTIAISVLAVIAVLYIGISGCYTIDQGDRGVVLRNGAAIGTADPGLNFKLPIIDSVVVLSTRTEKETYQDVEAYSKDIQPANIRVSINWSIRPSEVVSVYSKYGTTVRERILDPLVPKKLKEVFGQFQAATVVSDRVRLGMLVQDAIVSGVPPEIIVESVQIENVDFSDSYEKAIEQSMQAQAEIQRNQNQLQSVKIEAEKVEAQAAGEAAATKLRADAEAYRTEAAGRAEASAIAARGQALRDNPNLIGLTAVEKWNGTLPTTMVPGSTVPFIDVTATRPQQ